MRILIAYGSKLGGTEGIARTIGDTLTQLGHRVDILPANTVDGLDVWDAVVVGGALYIFRWQKHAKRFVNRHIDELKQMPVWFFSSGPVDDSAKKSDIPPVKQVSKLMARVQARGHKTFGGRLAPDAQGFMAQNLVKRGMVGDFRDMDQVRQWTSEVEAELSKLQMPERRPVSMQRGYGPMRRLSIALCLFTGITAMAGGAELVLWPNGAPWAPWLSPSILQHTPFSNFLVPGLLLFWLVGVVNVGAGLMVQRRSRWSAVAAFGAGASLTIWIVTEMILFQAVHWLHLLYLGAGVLTMMGGLWLWMRRTAVLRNRREITHPMPA